ncbi:hypothetical protein Moror_3707 [Moniliophthora roreri MCA 2997]|uniref:Protein kinase domain-containing protein n=1 Tax=Moniliophthora roreri (strain MCA 2997) TaxID=1381753 RepID=V2WQN1_MONRO|nr:hypothetical protein Moror_3707 [Moniliophthora roreri MCA 2997]
MLRYQVSQPKNLLGSARQNHISAPLLAGLGRSGTSSDPELYIQVKQPFGATYTPKRRHHSSPNLPFIEDFDDEDQSQAILNDILDVPSIGRSDLRMRREPLDQILNSNRQPKRPRLHGWRSGPLFEEPEEGYTGLQRSIDVERELSRMAIILKDEVQYQKLVCQSGVVAQYTLDLLQQLADYAVTTSPLRSLIYKAMLRLSSNSGLHPQCLAINHVEKLDDHPVAGGGFGDVWKGMLGRAQSQVVCLKIVKVYLTSDVQKLFSEYLQEAIVWRQLRHQGVLPFLGLYYLDNGRKQLCLVSPWMERGNLVQFLRKTDSKDVDHHLLVYDIAVGLEYLHRTKIVHGDLKGVNILIKPSGRPCIADFGLARVADSQVFRMSSSTDSHQRGTVRWLAPEVHGGKRTSKSSDIYAFGCVCYEIFSGGYPPFHDVLHDSAVIIKVLVHKERPSRPLNTPALTDSMWSIVDSCWNAEEDRRPTAETVVKLLKRFEPISAAINEDKEWDESLASALWESVEYPPIAPNWDVLERLLSQLESDCVS